MYMLDTNICIFIIKNKPLQVIDNLKAHKPEEICISSITYSELRHGVEKSQARDRNEVALTLFLSAIDILPFDTKAAEEYGRIRAVLEKQGTPIGPMDMLIAAHAKSNTMTVVTNNTREFQRVPDLPLEDWTQKGL